MAARSKRVVIADGYRDAADSLAVVLGLHGYETRVVYDGAAAARLVEEWQPDAAIIDLDFRDGSGPEIAHRIRAERRSLTLIGTTGWTRQRLQSMAASAGFDHVQLKPVDFRRLLQLLDDDTEVRPA
jgi:DNA-binding response OmpR family regulator